MRRWFPFLLVVTLLVAVNGRTYGSLQRRNQALERALALGENQMQTIERQAGLLERQTEALNQCSQALDRVARLPKTVPRS